MKKLKSILCIIFAFILTAIVLCACGINNKENQKVGTKTMISLTEAKQLIVSALAINNNQLQTQSTNGMRVFAASANEGNRDIMEKLGRFSYNEYITETDIETAQEVGNTYVIAEMLYESEIKKCLMENNWDTKPIIDYFDSDNHICYTYDDEKEDDEKISSRTYSDEELNINRFAYVRALFKDEAFDSIYDDTATKEINQNGYSITLTGDLKGWIRYTYFLWGDYAVTDEEIDSMYNESIKDLPQETIDKCYFNLTVNIDSNNDVVSAAVNVKYIQSGKFICMSVTLTKTNAPIVEPDWVTEYKNSHN